MVLRKLTAAFLVTAALLASCASCKKGEELVLPQQSSMGPVLSTHL